MLPRCGQECKGAGEQAIAEHCPVSERGHRFPPTISATPKQDRDTREAGEADSDFRENVERLDRLHFQPPNVPGAQLPARRRGWNEVPEVRRQRIPDVNRKERQPGSCSASLGLGGGELTAGARRESEPNHRKEDGKDRRWPRS